MEGSGECCSLMRVSVKWGKLTTTGGTRFGWGVWSEGRRAGGRAESSQSG